MKCQAALPGPVLDLVESKLRCSSGRHPAARSKSGRAEWISLASVAAVPEIEPRLGALEEVGGAVETEPPRGSL